jgi:hypothetical protein
MRTAAIILIAVVGAFSIPSGAYAGPYSDALAQCLVKSTSEQDRAQLVQWMFLVLSRHPALKSMAPNDPAALDHANRSLAQLMMRLVTKSCRSQTREVIKYEGTEAMKQSFGVLGRVAATNLFANPDVSQAMSGFTKYLDKQKLEAVSKLP